MLLPVALNSLKASAQDIQLSQWVMQYVSIPPGTIALTHTTLIDGTGAPAKRDQTIVITGSTITQVGPSDSAKIPAGARVLDLTRKTVFPGIVGMHEHLYFAAYVEDHAPTLNQMNYSFPRLYLAGGVTTMRTAGALEGYTDLELKQQIDDGNEPGPTIHVTAPILDGPSYSLMHHLKDPEEAARTVRYWSEEGAASADVDDPALKKLFSVLIQHRVAITSTLPVLADYAGDAPSVDPRVLEVLLPESRASCLEQRSHMGNPHNPMGAIVEKEMKLEKMFVDTGGTLLAGLDPTGTGCVVAGFGDQREIELLVKSGFRPVEAIRIATLNGAQFLNIADKVGTVAVGKQADLVIVRGDPSQRIEDIENVETVFKAGAGFDAAKLIQSAKAQVGLR